MWVYCILFEATRMGSKLTKHITAPQFSLSLQGHPTGPPVGSSSEYRRMPQPATCGWFFPMALWHQSAGRMAPVCRWIKLHLRMASLWNKLSTQSLHDRCWLLNYNYLSVLFTGTCMATTAGCNWYSSSSLPSAPATTSSPSKLIMISSPTSTSPSLSTNHHPNAATPKHKQQQKNSRCRHSSHQTFALPNSNKNCADEKHPPPASGQQRNSSQPKTNLWQRVKCRNGKEWRTRLSVQEHVCIIYIWNYIYVI